MPLELQRSSHRADPLGFLVSFRFINCNRSFEVRFVAYGVTAGLGDSYEITLVAQVCYVVPDSSVVQVSKFLQFLPGDAFAVGL